MDNRQPKPKHSLGDELTVEFIGKVVASSYSLKGEIEYKIDDGQGNLAWVRESKLFTLPTPADFSKEPQGEPIKCLICQKEFSSPGTFSEHLYDINNRMLKDHIPPKDYRYREVKKCYYCGGDVHTFGAGYEGWETSCDCCGFLYDED